MDYLIPLMFMVGKTVSFLYELHRFKARISGD
jgi:hypothetical protein